MRALARRGMRVGAAKCGPDYIDPAFHKAATGRESLNLDSWAMDEGLIADLAARAGRDADIVIAEASMGLFDGAPERARPHRRLGRHRRRDRLAGGGGPGCLGTGADGGGGFARRRGP